MAEQDDTASNKIALIAMPWALFNRPSIQLGTLKAYQEKHSDVKVDAFHPYLTVSHAIGTNKYHAISVKPWAGEALYSKLLFPENLEAKKLFIKSFKPKEFPWADFDTLYKQVQEATEAWLQSIDFSKYSLIGFTVCFDQLLSSLFAAQYIKSSHSNIPIAFGGSSCCGDVGKSILENFTQVDYVIDGEGENSLLLLVDHLQNGSGLPPQVISKKNDVQPISKPVKITLNDLPTPDFTHYFQELKKTYPTTPFSPTIPIEFSRGCWWNKCSFCNLNLQWCDYRWKTAEKVAGEIATHSTTHEVLDFTFTDNALPPKECDRFFEAAASQAKDFHFFAEIRAITSTSKLKSYRAGGLTTVQVGIEALSESLLKKMTKGMSVMDNIAIMKFCSENDIILEGNLITDFPGSDEDEVLETLETLEFVHPFNPLSTAKFFLGYGSPVQKHPAQHGIIPILHKNNSMLFPPSLRKMTFLVSDYRGEKTKQQAMWKPVVKKVKQWQQFHSERKSAKSALYYRDGGNFITIHQYRESAPLTHKLKNASRLIYLYCEEPRTIESILSNFKQIPKKSLTDFLKDLHDKRLLYFKNGKALALAIHHK